MADNSTEKLSTTALAKQLELPVQQLFSALKDYGWINRTDKTWALTGKGEFEGGEYRDSQRFGRYIVWPETLKEHPLISAIEAEFRYGAAALAKFFDVPPRTLNRALAELGMQVHTISGWEITEKGKHLGGIQEESESSGSLYVSWPKEMVDNHVLQREIYTLCGVNFAGNTRRR